MIHLLNIIFYMIFTSFFNNSSDATPGMTVHFHIYNSARFTFLLLTKNVYGTYFANQREIVAASVCCLFVKPFMILTFSI